jgi:uridine phosphorylase
MASEEQATGIMKLKPSQISPRVLTVGDPARAAYVASLLQDVVVVAQNREYHTYTGTYNGVKITVASHGVGGGGASMCFEELIMAGAKLIVRAGTCGSFQPSYREGALFIATGAVRNDGVTDRLVPAAYPATASGETVAALQKACGDEKEPLAYTTGVMLTEGCFYDGPLGNQHQMWAKSGVLGVEMEASVLFVIAGVRGIKSGGIFNVDNYIFARLEAGDGAEAYHPHREVVIKGNERMCRIALEAVASMTL